MSKRGTLLLYWACAAILAPAGSWLLLELNPVEPRSVAFLLYVVMFLLIFGIGPWVTKARRGRCNPQAEAAHGGALPNKPLQADGPSGRG